MIFILDRQERVVNILKNNGGVDGAPPFFDDTLTEDLSTGAETFQFTTIGMGDVSKDLTVGNFVAFKKNNKYKLFQIMQLEESHEDVVYITVYCESAGLELINRVFRKRTINSATLRKFLETVLEDSGWNVGLVEGSVVDTIDLELEDSTIYATLQNNISKYNCELEFRVEINGGRITSKFVDVYANRGKVTGKRFVFGQDIEGLTRKTDSTELYTALIGRGKNGLSFKDVVLSGIDKPAGQDFVADQESYERYNHNGYHIMGLFEFDTESPEELLRETYKHLQKVKEPRYEYEVEVALLGELLGEKWNTVSIGDTVLIVDHAFNPPIQLMARVSQLETSFTNPQGDKCVLSNFVEVKSNISDEMRKIASELEGYVDGTLSSKFPIKSEDISEGAVNGSHIYQSSITTEHLKADSIEAGHIKADQIQAEHIKANSIATEHLEANSITTDKLSANSVTADKILAGEINANHIGTDTIHAHHIKAGEIEAGHIKADQIEADHLKANSVTTDKLIANSVTTDKIFAGSITTDKLSANSVTAEKIKAGEIEGVHIKGETIEGVHIKGNVIEGGHIKGDSISAGHLQSGSVSTEHLSAGSVNADKIQAGTITAGSSIISEGAIGSAQISKLSADKIDAGTIDTSKITVAGADGNLKISGNRLQVFTGVGNKRFERVSLGDVHGDGTVYGFLVRGSDGQTVLMDETGVKQAGITDGSINNEKISNDANIDGAKLNINSVVNKINEDGTNVISGTKIEVDGTNLSTKLSTITTTQDEHGEKIVNQQSSIEANEKAIKLKVDNQTYQTDKEGLETKLEKNTSSIDVLQKEIVAKVEQVDIEKSIDGIKLGGRNYALGSKIPTTIVGENKVNQCVKVADVNMNDVIDKQITISFNWELSDGATATRIYLQTGGGNYWVVSSDNIPLDQPKGRISYTTIWKPVDKNFLRIEARCDDLIGQVIISKVMIEEGNKPSDYSIPPEDVDSEITKIKESNAQLKIDLNSISSKVESTETTIESVKQEILYKVDIIATNGTTFVNGNVQTILKAKVYRGQSEITNELETSKFIWKRISSYPEEDEIWNQTKGIGKKEIEVTRNDVYERATFSCEIIN